MEIRMPRQDSLYDQLKSVFKEAIKIGCYDAADFIKKEITIIERNLIESEKKRIRQEDKK